MLLYFLFLLLCWKYSDLISSDQIITPPFAGGRLVVIQQNLLGSMVRYTMLVHYVLPLIS